MLNSALLNVPLKMHPLQYSDKQAEVQASRLSDTYICDQLNCCSCFNFVAANR